MPAVKFVLVAQSVVHAQVLRYLRLGQQQLLAVSRGDIMACMHACTLECILCKVHIWEPPAVAVGRC